MAIAINLIFRSRASAAEEEREKKCTWYWNPRWHYYPVLVTPVAVFFSLLLQQHTKFPSRFPDFTFCISNFNAKKLQNYGCSEQEGGHDHHQLSHTGLVFVEKEGWTWHFAQKQELPWVSAILEGSPRWKTLKVFPFQSTLVERLLVFSKTVQMKEWKKKKIYYKGKKQLEKIIAD